MTHCKKSKPALDAKIPALEDKFFHYGSNMKSNWIEVGRSLLDYVGRKYGQSENSSLVEEVLTMTEVDQDVLPKFKTQKEKHEHIDAL